MQSHPFATNVANIIATCHTKRITHIQTSASTISVDGVRSREGRIFQSYLQHVLVSIEFQTWQCMGVQSAYSIVNKNASLHTEVCLYGDCAVQPQTDATPEPPPTLQSSLGFSCSRTYMFLVDYLFPLLDVRFLTSLL